MHIGRTSSFTFAEGEQVSLREWLVGLVGVLVVAVFELVVLADVDDNDVLLMELNGGNNVVAGTTDGGSGSGNAVGGRSDGEEN
jgi:hypothetical protein